MVVVVVVTVVGVVVVTIVMAKRLIFRSFLINYFCKKSLEAKII